MIDKDMLEAIGQLLDAKMENALTPILDDIGSMKDDIQSLKADNSKLVTLEKKVDLLLDGMAGMNEKFAKLDAVAEDVEDIKLTVRAMEAVTQRNSKDIQNLRAVK